MNEPLKLPESIFYAYRNQTPTQGKFKGVRLDTFEKAKEYVDWQYDIGLLTKEDKLSAYMDISTEFERQDLYHY